MKGILLAGGTGSRLWPLTRSVSKQLLPVYDKPMVFYPLSTLMLAGLREVLVISNPEHLDAYRRLLGDGSQLGMAVDYVVQERPEGLPQAFVLAESYLAGQGAALALGDNLMFGAGLGRRLESLADRPGGTVFGIEMADPRPYGVVEFDADGRVLSIVEKPERPASRWAVPGLYFFDERVVELARALRPSARGELEIVDLHRAYLELGELSVRRLARGTAWFDMGTIDALLQAGEYVATIQQRQHVPLGSPEEIAWTSGWIDDAAMARLVDGYGASGYATMLRELLDRGPGDRSQDDGPVG